MSRAPRSTHGLYLITDPALTAAKGLEDCVSAALRGGTAWVQYRNKHATASQRLREARLLAVLCREFDVALIINDDPRLAAEVDADGVHIGVDDGAYIDARRIVGSEKIVGVSCYDSLPRARQAAAAGADYVAFGSIFPSPTKPDAVPASLTLLRHARAALSLPIVAIGGITPANALSVLRAGADMIAVISGVLSNPDPESAARSYVAVTDHPHST